MPVFNAAPFLQRAVDSVLAQSFTNFRLLVINDGSTDDSATILARICDPRLTVWDQPNCGLVHCINRGVAYAREQGIAYVARMDGDDVSEPTRLATQVALLEARPDAAACSCNCLYIDEAERVIGSSTVPMSPALIAWELRHNLRGMVHGATPFRTEAIDAVGGCRPHFVAAEDVDLFLRLSERYRLINAPQFLYRIRLHPVSMSVANARRNSMSCRSAWESTRRRRHGRAELSFDAFATRMGWVQRALCNKEQLVLALWRSGMPDHRFHIVLGILLSPRRLVARLLRVFESRRFGAGVAVGS